MTDPRHTDARVSKIEWKVSSARSASLLFAASVSPPYGRASRNKCNPAILPQHKWAVFDCLPTAVPRAQVLLYRLRTAGQTKVGRYTCTGDYRRGTPRHLQCAVTRVPDDSIHSDPTLASSWAHHVGCTSTPKAETGVCGARQGGQSLASSVEPTSAVKSP